MTTEDRLQKLEEEIALLKQRNVGVEGDKAWETSTYRILSITVLTYVVASAVLYTMSVPYFYLNAIIPVIGYLLSVQSLPVLKRKWMASRRKKQLL